MSLGWMTESTLTKKRGNDIIVNPSSINDLRAAFYSTADGLHADGVDKEAQKRFKVQVTRDRADAPDDLGSSSNSGVQKRDSRDRTDESSRSSAERSELALKIKAKIYDRIARGQLPPVANDFLIDFESKGSHLLEMDGSAVLIDDDESQNALAVPASMQTDSMRREAERQRWESEAFDEIEQGVLSALKVAPRPSTGVRQKWEYTLSAEEKQYLQEIREETIRERAAAEDAKKNRLSEAHERRQLIRDKEMRKQQFFAAMQAKFASA